jgi:energy-coupling factor transporter ATP-binding protein EcfA2
VAIVEVDLTDEREREGLGPIRMNRLGRIVLLAGPNGSGKTRLLRRINALMPHARGPAEIERLKKTVEAGDSPGRPPVLNASQRAKAHRQLTRALRLTITTEQPPQAV